MTEKHAYDFDLRLDDPVSTHAVQFRMIEAGSRVLDVGCHTGILGEALRTKKKCYVVGIDNDKAALDVARQRLDEVVPGNLEDPGWSRSLAKNGFDVLLFGDVIEHTKEPSAILGEAGSLLHPNGFAIVSLPNIANLRIRLRLLFGNFGYDDSGILDRTHLRFFTLTSGKKLLEDSGYGIEEVRYSGYSLPRWLINLFPRLLAVNMIFKAKLRSTLRGQNS